MRGNSKKAFQNWHRGGGTKKEGKKKKKAQTPKAKLKSPLDGTPQAIDKPIVQAAADSPSTGEAHAGEEVEPGQFCL